MIVIQVYASTTNAKAAEVEWFCEKLQDLLELTPKKKKKKCPFHHRELECKSRNSKDTWSNRQVWPWSTNEVGKRPTEFCQEFSTAHSKHSLPKIQEMMLHMDVTRWSRPKSDWLYSLQKFYTVSKNKIRSWLWLRSWTPYCQIQT